MSLVFLWFPLPPSLKYQWQKGSSLTDAVKPSQTQLLFHSTLEGQRRREWTLGESLLFFTHTAGDCLGIQRLTQNMDWKETHKTKKGLLQMEMEKIVHMMTWSSQIHYSEAAALNQIFFSTSAKGWNDSSDHSQKQSNKPVPKHWNIFDRSKTGSHAWKQDIVLKTDTVYPTEHWIKRLSQGEHCYSGLAVTRGRN